MRVFSWAAVSAAAFIMTSLPAHADSIAEVRIDREALPRVWEPAGGEVIEFNVFRKGQPFGEHKLSFERSANGDLKVENDIRLTARFGPIVVYRYRHQSTETWSDGRLIALEGETRKEGDDFDVNATADGDALNVMGTLFEGAVDPQIVPSSHWNRAEVYSDRILSSESGELLEVSTSQIGRETLEIGGEAVDATRYRLVSDLTVDLWYDQEGRWVKCAFEARGQNIEYVLKSLY